MSRRRTFTPWGQVFNLPWLAARRPMVSRFGAAHVPSPDVHYGHPVLRSLDADCASQIASAPASCLRLSATPALGTWAAPHGSIGFHTSPGRKPGDTGSEHHPARHAHAARCSDVPCIENGFRRHAESPGFRRGLLVNRPRSSSITSCRCPRHRCGVCVAAWPAWRSLPGWRRGCRPIGS